VAPREDGLGLGARRNRGDECTGLDDLNDLLGRLNGRPAADLDADRRARAEVRLGHYVERRFGRMRFVSGGFLGRLDGLVVEEGAGDGAPLGEEEAEVSQEFSQEETSDAVREKRRKEKKAKKRKARNEDPGSEAGSSRKEKKRKAKAGDDQSTEPPASAGEDVRESRSKKRKSKKDRGTAGDSAEDSTVATVKTRSRTDTLKESGESMPSSEAEAPAMSGRHLARKRFIAQKRRALMDEQALKQVCWVAASDRGFDFRYANPRPDIYDQDIDRYPILSRLSFLVEAGLRQVCLLANKLDLEASACSCALMFAWLLSSPMILVGPLKFWAHRPS